MPPGDSNESETLRAMAHVRVPHSQRCYDTSSRDCPCTSRSVWIPFLANELVPRHNSGQIVTSQEMRVWHRSGNETSPSKDPTDAAARMTNDCSDPVTDSVPPTICRAPAPNRWGALEPEAKGAGRSLAVQTGTQHGKSLAECFDTITTLHPRWRQRVVCRSEILRRAEPGRELPVQIQHLGVPLCRIVREAHPGTEQEAQRLHVKVPQAQRQVVAGLPLPACRPRLPQSQRLATLQPYPQPVVVSLNVPLDQSELLCDALLTLDPSCQPHQPQQLLHGPAQSSVSISLGPCNPHIMRAAHRVPHVLTHEGRLPVVLHQAVPQAPSPPPADALERQPHRTEHVQPLRPTRGRPERGLARTLRALHSQQHIQ